MLITYEVKPVQKNICFATHLCETVGLLLCKQISLLICQQVESGKTVIIQAQPLHMPAAQAAKSQVQNTENGKSFQRAIRKFIKLMTAVPATTIVFSSRNDEGFRTFQKLVMTLLPGAMSIKGIQTTNSDGKHIFKIEEIRDVSNKVIWTRPEQGHGQLEELLYLWESRIYKWHDLSIRRP